MILIAIASVIFTISCTKKAAEPEKEIILPESDLNYTDHIYPLFVQKCGYKSGCHSSYEPARGLDLTVYENFIDHYIDGVVPLIIEGDGGNSFLYNILIEPEVLGRLRMPLYDPPLSANQIVGIRQWIDEDAPKSR